MDEATQQNAALVEEATAAARSMEEQAGQLTQAVAVFKIEAAPTIAARTPSTTVARLKPVAHHAASRPAPAKPPIKRTATLAAAPSNGADWQEF